MVSTVKARPNHYEVLGLRSTASAAEIAQAFALRMSPFSLHSMEGAAQLALAYEVLRNPEKRRAYDASLGLGQRPAPAASYSFVLSAPRNGAAFVTAARADASRPAVQDPLHAPAAPIPSEPRLPQRAAERESGSFIAEALRELARPADVAPTPSRAQDEPSTASSPLQVTRPAPMLDEIVEPEGLPPEVKRVALTLGGVLLGVGVLAAVAGWSSSLVEPQRTITSTLPKAKQAAAAIALPAAASAEPAVQAEPQHPTARHSVVRSRPLRQRSAAQPPALSDQQIADLPPVELHAAATESGAGPTTESAAAVPAAAVTQAKLPLSNAMIARTIGRIGYPCGAVASTAAGETPGVFTVTCTSGHSYRAAPVGGRYHFRKAGGH